MKDRFFYRVRRLFLFVCCAALTLLNGHARAQEEKLIETSAKAAVLIEKNTGRVLYRRNEETALPMASTTKVMDRPGWRWKKASWTMWSRSAETPSAFRAPAFIFPKEKSSPCGICSTG